MIDISIHECVIIHPVVEDELILIFILIPYHTYPLEY